MKHEFHKTISALWWKVSKSLLFNLTFLCFKSYPETQYLQGARVPSLKAFFLQAALAATIDKLAAGSIYVTPKIIPLRHSYMLPLKRHFKFNYFFS